VAEVQAMVNVAGSYRERRKPIADLRFYEDTGRGNVVGCFAADGTHLCDVGWRPFEQEHAPTFLFICG